MSGVLFVIYVPTKETEQKLRDRHEADQIRLEMEKKDSPLTTPEMQHIGSFSKVNLFINWFFLVFSNASHFSTQTL